jgi:hypothetical protein
MTSVVIVWGRVDVRRVHRAVDRQTGRYSEWFGRCWLTHDQSAPNGIRRRFRRSREQVWWEHYAAMSAYVSRVGGLPAQKDSAEARVLYRCHANQDEEREPPAHRTDLP